MYNNYYSLIVSISDLLLTLGVSKKRQGANRGKENTTCQPPAKKRRARGTVHVGRDPRACALIAVDFVLVQKLWRHLLFRRHRWYSTIDVMLAAITCL